MKHKILHVLEATLGGTRRHVVDLLLGLDQKRFEPHFAYSPLRADDLFWEELTELKLKGIRCHTIPMCRSISITSDVSSAYRLYQLLRRERFAIVHGHSSKAGFISRMAAKAAWCDVKTVYTPNAIAVKIHPFYAKLERLAGRFTDALVAVSASEREEIRASAVISEDRLVTIYSGIQMAHSTTPVDRSSIGVPGNGPIIASCGRLASQKDPMTFLFVARRVIQNHPDARFLWIGDGELKRDMQQLASKLSIADNVHWISFQNRVAPVLAVCDVFLLTSTYESFGYVTCEAMALSKPVVATDVAGTRDLVVPNVTGILAPAGDAEGLSNGVCRIITDPQRGRSFGENGRRHVEKLFSAREMVRKTEQLYMQLLEASGRCEPMTAPTSTCYSGPEDIVGVSESSNRIGEGWR